MKKVFAILSIVVICGYGIPVSVLAQEVASTEESTETAATVSVAVETLAPAEVEEGGGLHKSLKTKFIEGDAIWMSPVALVLILGLALSIERIIYLSLSSTNTKKLLANINDAWERNGVEAAMEVCRNTRGPVASIFYQGLSRHDEGVEVIEKTVASYGGVQLGLLEKNLTWISLFIALAPSLGFLGTVIGMIQAFDKIQQVGDISPTVVAGGMKDKILTRITGIIAILLLAVSIIIVGVMYLGPAEIVESATGDPSKVPAATDTLIYWCYALLIVTAVATVGFAIMKFVNNLIVNLKSGIKTLVTLAVFVLIFIVAWNLGSPDKVSIFGYEGNQNEGFWAQLTDMIIYVCYSLFALVFLAIIGSRIYVKLK